MGDMLQCNSCGARRRVSDAPERPQQAVRFECAMVMEVCNDASRRNPCVFSINGRSKFLQGRTRGQTPAHAHGKRPPCIPIPTPKKKRDTGIRDVDTSIQCIDAEEGRAGTAATTAAQGDPHSQVARPATHGDRQTETPVPTLGPAPCDASGGAVALQSNSPDRSVGTALVAPAPSLRHPRRKVHRGATHATQALALGLGNCGPRVPSTCVTSYAGLQVDRPAIAMQHGSTANKTALPAGDTTDDDEESERSDAYCLPVVQRVPAKRTRTRRHQVEEIRCLDNFLKAGKTKFSLENVVQSMGALVPGLLNDFKNHAVAAAYASKMLQAYEFLDVASRKTWRAQQLPRRLIKRKKMVSGMELLRRIENTWLAYHAQLPLAYAWLQERNVPREDSEIIHTNADETMVQRSYGGLETMSLEETPVKAPDSRDACGSVLVWVSDCIHYTMTPHALLGAHWFGSDTPGGRKSQRTRSALKALKGEMTVADPSVLFQRRLRAATQQIPRFQSCDRRRSRTRGGNIAPR